MPGIAIVKRGKRFGEGRKQLGEGFYAAFNQDSGGEALGRPVRRGGCGRCVGLRGES